MADYRLSEKAGYDLDDIADYTFEAFGERQTDKYCHDLLSTFALLAERPQIGRAAGYLAAALRSYPFQAHIIYYRITGDGILIVRILHGAQDPARHL